MNDCSDTQLEVELRTLMVPADLLSTCIHSEGLTVSWGLVTWMVMVRMCACVCVHVRSHVQIPALFCSSAIGRSIKFFIFCLIGMRTQLGSVFLSLIRIKS